ncbi:UNVERIFIED_CONTAM: type II toxin-antitoxin system RelE/ParE family toxin [Streptococcus canis]|uniref:Plasmid stabilization system protein n=1 Tax=Streptococcus canis FSL Z3-227 TaxID=482234 RepID=A0AAV3FP77_STRCB|nr:type II toxin-antitoxin system RelE/ParE family toxin [Streptococcus canis]QBX13579.1 toxin to DNA-damage-inducible protein J [Streptococcus satellite phage Javan96]EIQ80953.1 plasmid stabilization system protein [Streptococcus canis FSL Z3-227]MDV5987457.1 type II toxin-antitoxin system RelE/ParE family toxin [Streptococcus canis]MDV5993950.1 type II toxin-antitoxin system RelE/ParE family toxin [Streptococcus canis]MDV6000286.1 type II toxin-antitoxin system RelE/ParE family toxin [Strept
MVSDNKTHSLIIPETVQEQLRAIKSYIETTYFSEQAGANTVNNILYGLERLEFFPEAGFNADDRVGETIYPPHNTRCIVLGDYLAFYHILEDGKAVFVSDIIHSKQDYIRLFKKK